MQMDLNEVFNEYKGRAKKKNHENPQVFVKD